MRWRVRGAVIRRVVHIAVAEDGRVDTDGPLVVGAGHVAVRGMHEQRLEVGAGREARDLEYLMAEHRAARRVCCAAQGIGEPRRVRPQLENDGVPARTDGLQVEHHSVVGRPCVAAGGKGVRGDPVALLATVEQEQHAHGQRRARGEGAHSAEGGADVDSVVTAARIASGREPGHERRATSDEALWYTLVKPSRKSRTDGATIYGPTTLRLHLSSRLHLTTYTRLPYPRLPAAVQDGTARASRSMHVPCRRRPRAPRRRCGAPRAWACRQAQRAAARLRRARAAAAARATPTLPALRWLQLYGRRACRVVGGAACWSWGAVWRAASRTERPLGDTCTGRNLKKIADTGAT
eukprot:scaffold56534_cov60-Phaeocystis_antarctica.AAC.5